MSWLPRGEYYPSLQNIASIILIFPVSKCYWRYTVLLIQEKCFCIESACVKDMFHQFLYGRYSCRVARNKHACCEMELFTKMTHFRLHWVREGKTLQVLWWVWFSFWGQSTTNFSLFECKLAARGENEPPWVSQLHAEYYLFSLVHMSIPWGYAFVATIKPNLSAVRG